MTLHDPSARLGDEKKARRFRLRFPRSHHQLAAGPPAPAAAAVSRRDLRRLAAIDRKLADDAPALASMFAMFNGLTKGEGPVGTERLAVRARPRPRPVHLALLLTLAAVAALFVALSAQIHPVLRPCPTTAAATAVAPSGHTTSCSAYATNNPSK
jgi:Protein of unknown function (DUF3040)